MYAANARSMIMWIGENRQIDAKRYDTSIYLAIGTDLTLILPDPHPNVFAHTQRFIGVASIYK